MISAVNKHHEIMIIRDIPVLWRLVGFQYRDEPSHGGQRLVQVVGAHLGGDPVGPGVLRQRDLADGVVPGLGAGQQLGPAVDGVRAVLGRGPGTEASIVNILSL